MRRNDGGFLVPYVEAVDTSLLQEAADGRAEVRLSVACRMESVR